MPCLRLGFAKRANAMPKMPYIPKVGRMTSYKPLFENITLTEVTANLCVIIVVVGAIVLIALNIDIGFWENLITAIVTGYIGYLIGLNRKNRNN